MSVSSREGIPERAKEALQPLACSADAQIWLLPSFVCAADELALEFGHWREVLIENCGDELRLNRLRVLLPLTACFQGSAGAVVPTNQSFGPTKRCATPKTGRWFAERRGKYWLVLAGLLQYRPAMRMNM